MERIFGLILVMGCVTLGLAGCYYVVPAPPPPPGVAPVVPQFVRERPHCNWKYGTGWQGWAWYSSNPC